MAIVPQEVPYHPHSGHQDVSWCASSRSSPMMPCGGCDVAHQRTPLCPRLARLCTPSPCPSRQSDRWGMHALQPRKQRSQQFSHVSLDALPCCVQYLRAADELDQTISQQ
jgi:hypothetical protein